MKPMKIYISGKLANGERYSISRDDESHAVSATLHRNFSRETSVTISAMLTDIEAFVDTYEPDAVDWSEQ